MRIRQFYPSSRRPAFSPQMDARNHGFTLIELLVVVAIIALLIAILLPSLGRARERANLVRCGANMKGITLAVLTYNDQNNQRMIIEATAATGQPPISNYVNGFAWQAELVKGGYITAPANDTTTGALILSTKTVFYCPKGLAQAGGQGDWPTDPINNGYDNSSGSMANPGVLTWYQLTFRVSGSGTNAFGTGSEQSPFIYYQQRDIAADSIIGQTRHMSMVTRPSDLILLHEGSNNNNVANGSSATYAGEFLKRWSARHLDTENNGLDATMNLAYFDGHVAPFRSKPIATTNGDFTNYKGLPICYLNKQ